MTVVMQEQPIRHLVV